MSIQLLVLAAVAVFLVLKLRSTLGTRTGYEPPSDARMPGAPADDAVDSATQTVEDAAEEAAGEVPEGMIPQG